MLSAAPMDSPGDTGRRDALKIGRQEDSSLGTRFRQVAAHPPPGLSVHAAEAAFLPGVRPRCSREGVHGGLCAVLLTAGVRWGLLCHDGSCGYGVSRMIRLPMRQNSAECHGHSIMTGEPRVTRSIAIGVGLSQ